MAKRINLIAMLAALVSSAACGVHQANTPTLAGPSELALAIGVSAIPDSISQDGASQSSISVVAHDASGKAISGLPIRVEIQANGVPLDYGTLSAKSIVTGTDGKATTVYTAPPAPPANQTSQPTCAGVIGTCVTIVATPTGSNFQTSLPFSTNIRLVPPGVIGPPATTPVVNFTFPTPVNANVPVTFDASTSCGGPLANGVCNYPITSYAWTFGDGSTGSGKTVSHTYTSAGTLSVTLTATNDRGVAASATQPVTVGVSAAPTASFVFSPTSPAAGQSVVFNADATRAAPGRTITQYSWIFGDGGTASGFLVTHAFAAAGAYNVTLSVLDDVGQKTTVSQSVTVTAGGGSGSGQTIASFTFSPLTPSAGQPIFFNAAASSAAAGHTLTTYAWDFGDGTNFAGSVATATHSFTAAGTFTVTLVVTDDTGQKATVKTPVTVTAASAGSLTAGFTASPTNPVSGALVAFNANTSTPLASITQFDWDFGDGTVINNGGMIINHTYNTPATANFTIRLTVHDASGNTNTATQALTVTLGSDPTANFTISPNPVAVGALVTVDGSASMAGAGAITTYQWNFGDSATIVTGNPQTHTYTAKGTYTIKLTVTQTNGRTNSTTHTIVVQ